MTYINMKITGLDLLTRKIKELEKAVDSLDGDIASLTFNPHDPQSIERAIQELNASVDEKIAGCAQN